MDMRISGNGFADSSRMYDIIKNQYNPHEADKITSQSVSEDDTAVYYNGMKGLLEGNFVTQFGGCVESKYGYAAEFDGISRAFGKRMDDHNYSAADMGTVVVDMEEKYQSLKADIENNYAGEERAERLAELDKTFGFLMKTNVTEPANVALQNENAMNKLRNAFAKAYENVKRTMSSEFVQIAYGGMENWRELSEEIGAELDYYKGLFVRLKESLENIHKGQENVAYANVLLKKITNGLAGINIKKEGFTQSGKTSVGNTTQKVQDLIEQKGQYCTKAKTTGRANSIKYQTFLQNRKKADVLDKKLGELLHGMEK